LSRLYWQGVIYVLGVLQMSQLPEQKKGYIHEELLLPPLEEIVFFRDTVNAALQLPSKITSNQLHSVVWSLIDPSMRPELFKPNRQYQKFAIRLWQKNSLDIDPFITVEGEWRRYQNSFIYLKIKFTDGDFFFEATYQAATTTLELFARLTRGERTQQDTYARSILGKFGDHLRSTLQLIQTHSQGCSRIYDFYVMENRKTIAQALAKGASLSTAILTASSSGIVYPKLGFKLESCQLNRLSQEDYSITGDMKVEDEEHRELLLIHPEKYHIIAVFTPVNPAESPLPYPQP
jgi:hypothetical protein